MRFMHLLDSDTHPPPRFRATHQGRPSRRKQSHPTKVTSNQAQSPLSKSAKNKSPAKEAPSHAGASQSSASTHPEHRQRTLDFWAGSKGGSRDVIKSGGAASAAADPRAAHPHPRHGSAAVMTVVEDQMDAMVRAGLQDELTQRTEELAWLRTANTELTEELERERTEAAESTKR